MMVEQRVRVARNTEYRNHLSTGNCSTGYEVHRLTYFKALRLVLTQPGYLPSVQY